jgi:hypothetical protein
MTTSRNRAWTAAAALSVVFASGGAVADGGSNGGPNFDFRSKLSPEQEVRGAAGAWVPASPANPAIAGTFNSDGSARGSAKFEQDLSSVHVRIRVNDLTQGVTDAHIHCARAGQNGPVLVPLNPTLGVTKGEIVDRDITNANILNAVGNVACLANCGIPITTIAALRAAAADGCLYFNVHTSFQPGGEVRGQLLSNLSNDD